MIDLLLYYLMPLLVCSVPTFYTKGKERFELIILALMPIGNWLWAFLIFVFGITYCIEKTISWVNAAADRSNTINKKDKEK